MALRVALKPLIDHKAPTLAYSAEHWDNDEVHPGEGDIVALSLACLQQDKPELKLESLSNLTPSLS